ncbi:MAG TPA: 50S ribosomal protein L24 [Candidatus Saccharimonadales bacterium]|nr:50S ribosomal protein L24 [Candidatus Saccharimonadales bacterium]
MKIKLGDLVKVISGAHKGKTAKVVSVSPAKNAIKLEGIGERKRFVKPNALNPQGGTKDIHVAIDASKVALVNPSDATKTTRVGYTVNKDGTKVRVARQAANKEIK